MSVQKASDHADHVTEGEDAKEGNNSASKKRFEIKRWNAVCLFF